jgi:hypothetical protein
MRQSKAKAIRRIVGSRTEYRAAKRHYTRVATSKAQNPKPVADRGQRLRSGHVVREIANPAAPMKKPVYSLHRAANGVGTYAAWALRNELSKLRPGIKMGRHESVDRLAGRLPSHLLQAATRNAIKLLSTRI